jgi:arylsulfatase A-like enzyme
MKSLTFRLFLSFLLVFPHFLNALPPEKPNVLLIITDDQGYGDVGINGNHHIMTPTLDKLAQESIVFRNFYVTPVCATTRAGLMTGRYNLRTGVRDTYNGGAIMVSDEITIAEMLKKEDYATGIFGKWHLGDNYPSRPVDQGFDESVIHLSGGMGQVGDVTTYFKFDSSYFDPVLWHNGQKEAYTGYCSDIFTQEAIKFIENNKDTPFFCYLSYNAPHTPLQVPAEYYEKYKEIDPSEGFDDGRPFPEMKEKDKEDARRVYAMIDNIDENLGKLIVKLDELKVAGNTIIIFMTDNGPQQRRYVDGMRGRKGSVYSGGIRVPLYLKYPALKKPQKSIETNTVNIDLLPTIAVLCGAQVPEDRIIDGKNLLPLIEGKTVKWIDRPIFFYWTRRYPELYSNMALLEGQYKLVGNADFNAPITSFELYDITSDPFEQNNLVSKEKHLAKQLKLKMDRMYNEQIFSKNMQAPPRITIGAPEENPIILNRNDAGGQRGIWAQEEVYGKWLVNVRKGTYNIRFKFIKPLTTKGTMLLETGTIIHKISHDGEATDIIEMPHVSLPDMDVDLVPFFKGDGKRIFPFWVELEKTG